MEQCHVEKYAGIWRVREFYARFGTIFLYTLPVCQVAGSSSQGVGHGCSADRTHSKPERKYELKMDALVIARIQKLNGIRSWAWMLGRPYALGTGTEL